MILSQIFVFQDELDLYMESEAGDYSKFSENLASRRRQVADQMAPPPTRSIIVGNGSGGSGSGVGKEPIVPKIQESTVLSYSNRGGANGAEEQVTSLLS